MKPLWLIEGDVGGYSIRCAHEEVLQAWQGWALGFERWRVLNGGLPDYEAHRWHEQGEVAVLLLWPGLAALAEHGGGIWPRDQFAYSPEREQALVALARDLSKLAKPMLRTDPLWPLLDAAVRRAGDALTEERQLRGAPLG